MKRALFTTILLCIFLSGSAQSDGRKFGFHAGVNYSDFRGYETGTGAWYSEKPAIAYLAGISFESELWGRMSVKIELNYERKSQKADNLMELTDENGTTMYDFTSKKKQDYLVMPVMLKYRFSDSNSFYLNGGPFAGYLISSKNSSDIDLPGKDPGDLDTSDAYKKLDFGLSIGIGKEFAIAQHNLYVEIRENLGLANTNKNPVWGDGNVKTNSISLIVGFSM